MASPLEIYNRALARIGIDQGLGDPDENSKQGVLFRLWFDASVRGCLRDFPWPFASRTIALAELPEPIIGWAHKYAYPADCLFARAVSDSAGIRSVYLDAANSVHAWGFDRFTQQRTPFSIMGETTAPGANRRVIVTDLPNAYLAYTTYIADANQYDDGFIDALTWRIAAEIAGPFLGAPTGQQVAVQCGKYYRDTVLTARAQAFNESAADYRPQSPAVTARL